MDLALLPYSLFIFSLRNSICHSDLHLPLFIGIPPSTHFRFLRRIHSKAHPGFRSHLDEIKVPGTEYRRRDGR